MKKIIYILTLSVFFLVGCESFVDIEQPGRLGAANAFSNVADLELGLLGVYNRFDNTQAIQFNAVFTDEVSIGADNGGQGIGDGEYGFRLNSESAISRALWTRFNAALNASSRLIEASEGLTVPAADQAKFNSVVGQAYALRAWAHFHLLTYYSTDLTDDSAPGIIIVNFVPGVDQALGRNTTGEVFAAIDADISKAESLITQQSNPTFVSRDFITALKARMAAYRGNYTQADGFAATLLTSYPIATRAQYEGIFSDANNTEVIFKLERTIGDSYDRQGNTGSGLAGGWAGANFAFVNATINGSPYYEMSNSLFDLLSTDDIRYNVMVEPTSDFAASSPDGNILVIGKYRGSEGQPLMNDVKIFRSSEMLLIRAEAAASANNFTAAAGFIDQLRDARYSTNQPTPVYATQQEAFADILLERRLELAYEGHRWVDMKRIGAKAGIFGVERPTVDCDINGACSLSLNDIRMKAVPIPIIELDANGVIQQTTGY